MTDLLAELSDFADRLEGVLRHGIVTEVRVAQNNVPKVKVKISEGAETSWRRWSARAGHVSVWVPPIVGERVLLFCPSGKLENAAVFPGFFCSEFPAPVSDLNKVGVYISDGTVLEHDNSNNQVLLKTPGKFIVDAEAQFLKPVEFKDEVQGRKSANFDEDVSDKKRSMQADREIFNKHTNPNMGASPPPASQQQ